MLYKDTFGEIRVVAAIEGHKKGKELVPSQTEFRIPPLPPRKVSCCRTSAPIRNNSGNLKKETVHTFEILKVKVSRYKPSRHRKEAEVNLYTYSIPALECGGWSATSPAALTR